jgi:hypothetical protein
MQKTTLIIGVDCAVDEANIGLAIGEYRTGTLDVRDFNSCSWKKPAQVIIAERLRGWRARALLAMDVPLGWPTLLSHSLIKHRAGKKIATEPNNMFRRSTDRFIKEKLGKKPLEVGADRIARTAHAALRLLGDLRKCLRIPIPLVWAPASIIGVTAIEVYPAATLLAHNLMPKNGYKRAEQIVQRRELVAHLHFISKLNFVTKTSSLENDANALDAVVCLLAAKDFQDGRAMPPSNLRLAKREGWIWASDRTTITSSAGDGK